MLEAFPESKRYKKTGTSIPHQTVEGNVRTSSLDKDKRKQLIKTRSEKIDSIS
jgi:hypothetical protein